MDRHLDAASSAPAHAGKELRVAIAAKLSRFAYNHVRVTNEGGLSMRVIWRFYVGEDARWRWQQLSVDRAVVAESRSSYEKYERCLAAAQAKGYIFEAAQPRLPRPGNRIYSRP